jgi:hypothetical protein
MVKRHCRDCDHYTPSVREGKGYCCYAVDELPTPIRRALGMEDNMPEVQESDAIMCPCFRLPRSEQPQEAGPA